MSIQNNKQEERELDQAPLLSALQHSKGFEAPEGYFDALPAQIQARLTTRHPGWFARIPSPAWITVFILLIGTGLLFNRVSVSDQKKGREMREVSVDELLQSGYYTEIEEDLLTEIIHQSHEAENLQNIEQYLIESTDETTISHEL